MLQPSWSNKAKWSSSKLAGRCRRMVTPFSTELTTALVE